MQFGLSGVRKPLTKGIAGVIGRSAAGVIPVSTHTDQQPFRRFSTFIDARGNTGQIDFLISSDTVAVVHDGARRGVFDREKLLTWMFDPRELLLRDDVEFSAAPPLGGVRDVAMSLPGVKRWKFSPTQLIELQVRLLVWGEEPIGTWFYGRGFG
jgi:hypothetical protein